MYVSETESTLGSPSPHGVRDGPTTRTNVVDDVVERMLALIAELRPGDRLPAERQLVQQLGVGRTSMREALRVLLSLGLIEVKGGRGTFVSQSDESFLNQAVMVSTLIGGRSARELYEVRLVIEPQVARLAAERASEEDLSEMRACLARQEAALDSLHDFLEADVAFHLAVARASQNRVFFQILRALRTLMMTRLATTLAARPTNTGPRFHEHAAVYEAIEQRDGEGASLAMAVHMRAFRHLIWSDDDDAR